MIVKPQPLGTAAKDRDRMMKAMVLGLAALLCASSVSSAQDTDPPAAPPAPAARITIVMASAGTTRQPRQLDLTGSMRALCGPDSRHCSLPCDLEAFPDIYKLRGKRTCSVVYRCGQQTSSTSARQGSKLEMVCESPLVGPNPYP